MLGIPGNNWPDDLALSSSDVTEGHDKGEEILERGMDVEIPIRIASDLADELTLVQRRRCSDLYRILYM